MSSIADLIDQMNPKRDPDDIDSTKKTQQTKSNQSTESNPRGSTGGNFQSTGGNFQSTGGNFQSTGGNFQSTDLPTTFKSTIKETEIDYYKILGVQSTATTLEIKRAYQSKLKKLHPDKVEQTPENKAKYKLIREAGDLLTNALERKAYDAQKKMEVTQKNHEARKDSFKEFLKLQEQGMTEENKSIAKLNFERTIADMDRKHGYNRKHEDRISEDECNRKIDDFKLHRSQEDLDIELEQQNIFKGRAYTSGEFNKFFDQRKKRDEKRKKKRGEITKHSENDISAFNDFEGGSGGVGIDSYGSLYGEGTYDDYNDMYAGVGSGMIGLNGGGQSDDDISIDSPDENEGSYDSHNKGRSKEELDSAYNKLLAERDDVDKKIESMKPTEYGSAIDDKYGISSQLGFMVGTDKFGHQKNIKSKRNVKEETIKAYKQLTEK
jgi:curved DNA-binding protein CbpA